MKVPILRLFDILLTSIQTDLTDREALDFQSDVLQVLLESDAGGVVIDITALDVVDSFMARVLSDTARMAQIMGAQVVLTGMQPMVALTLVQMGRGLVDAETALSLERGVEKLRGLIERKGEGRGS